MNSKAGKIFGAAVFYAAFYLTVAATGASAQVQPDTVSSGSAVSNTGVSSLTWQHTVTTGTVNRALFVSISTTTDPVTPGLPVCATQPLLCSSAALPPSASARVLGVTYAGFAMQFVGFRTSPDLRQAVEIYRLIAPFEGTNAVAVTLNPGSVFQAVGGASSFQNVSQFVPNGAFVSAAGNSNTAVLTVSDAGVGDAVIDALAIPPAALNATVGAGQIQRWNGRVFFNNLYDIGAGSTELGAAGAETMSWLTTNPGNWALAAIAVRRFLPTAAGVSVEGRVTTPTGRGLARARVTITGFGGESRTAITNSFGYFRFADIAPGETYIFNVSAKRYTFTPRVITVNEDITELKFVVETEPDFNVEL